MKRGDIDTLSVLAVWLLFVIAPLGALLHYRVFELLTSAVGLVWLGFWLLALAAAPFFWWISRK